MTIQIYKKGEVALLEEWADYPTVPNVGDRVCISGKIRSVGIVARVFSKNVIRLIVE